MVITWVKIFNGSRGLKIEYQLKFYSTNSWADSFFL